MQKCKDCNLDCDQFITDYQQGDIICPKCGLVQEQHILIDDKTLLDNQFKDPDYFYDVDKAGIFKSEKDILKEFIEENKNIMNSLNYQKTKKSLDFITRVSQILKLADCVVFCSYKLFLEFISQSSNHYIYNHADSICCGILYYSSKIFNLAKPLNLFIVYSSIKKKKFNKLLTLIKQFVIKYQGCPSQQLYKSSQEQFQYITNSLKLNKDSFIYKDIIHIHDFMSQKVDCHISNNPFTFAIICAYSAFIKNNDQKQCQQDFLKTLKQLSGISESYIENKSKIIIQQIK